MLKRGEQVVAVYVAPEKPGAKADPLKEAALAANFPVSAQIPTRNPRSWNSKHKTRPSGHGFRYAACSGRIPQLADPRLDPKLACRPIAAPAPSTGRLSKAKAEPGLSIFWPDNAVSIPATCSSRRKRDQAERYARHGLFRPAASNGRRGHAEIGQSRQGQQEPRIEQDEARATYEGRCTTDWGKPCWEQIDRLIRGSAWRLDHARRQAVEDFRRQAAAEESEGHAPASSAKSSP